MTREIYEPTLLCDDDGRLARGAVGWSRRPLHTANLRGAHLRKKRWDYWCITSATHVLAITVADVDYLGLVAVSLLDLATGEWLEGAAATPLGAGVRLAERVGETEIRFAGQGVVLSLRPAGAGLRIRAKARALGGRHFAADVDIERPAGVESLNVALPLGGGCFQFTSKQIGLPAAGELRVGGRRHALDGAVACLDHGRGIWPRRTSWCWAAAFGRDAATNRAIGLNLGGLWTDGSGSTENGVIVDGRLHKLEQRVRFSFAHDEARCAIRGDGIDLRFEGLRGRRVGLELGVLGARLAWHAGHFSGEVSTEAGERVPFDRVFGWAEEMHARW